MSLISVNDGQLDLIIFMLGTIIAILKGLELYLRTQQTQATRKQAIAQEETVKALYFQKK